MCTACHEAADLIASTAMCNLNQTTMTHTGVSFADEETFASTALSEATNLEEESYRVCKTPASAESAEHEADLTQPSPKLDRVDNLFR